MIADRGGEISPPFFSLSRRVERERDLQQKWLLATFFANNCKNLCLTKIPIYDIIQILKERKMHMFIGYSESTLWFNICKQMAEIKSESDWLQYYTARNETDCVEDCVRNIMDSCKAIMENIENLRGEKM
jgi:hypothetical protein